MRVLCVYLRRAPCCASPASRAPEPALTCPPCLRPWVGVERVLGQVPHSEVRQRSGRPGDARPRAAGPSPPLRAHLSCCLPSSRSGPGPGWTWSGAPPALSLQGSLRANLERTGSSGTAQKDGNTCTSRPRPPPTWAASAFPPNPRGPPTRLQPTCARLPPVPPPVSLVGSASAPTTLLAQL